MDYCELVAQLNRFELPKSMLRRFYREMNNDINKGLKDINKKIPVGIELPMREPVGNGMYKETSFDEDNSEIRDIVVCSSGGVVNNEDGRFIVLEEKDNEME